jgi:hypothetical protein
MRLPLNIALSLLAALGVFGLTSDCSPGSTTLLVTDCKGAPVEGARIDIKVCCAGNQQSSSVSASNGEATFNSNIKDICDAKVSFAGFSATSFGSGSCTAPDRNGNSKCTVQVCKR